MTLSTEEKRYEVYRYAADKSEEIDPSLARPAGAKPFEYRTPCQVPRGREESDLCAQWRAANAAEDSAHWAEWGFWLGIVGTIGLFGTLYYSRKAIEDAGDATKAMVRQNDLTIAAQRPWMSVSRWQTGRFQNSILNGIRVRDGLLIFPEWANSGQSPALTKSLYTTFELCPPNADIPIFDRPQNTEDHETLMLLGPATTQSGPLQILTDEQTEELRTGKLAMYVYSCCVYSDTFDQSATHISEVCVKVTSMGGTRTQDGHTEMHLAVVAVGPQNTISTVAFGGGAASRAEGKVSLAGGGAARNTNS